MNIKFITKKEFDKLKAEDIYWKDRWGYLEEVINILSKESFNSVLELGPYKETLVKGSDVMDINPFYQNIKYKWNATKTPWPIEDKKYDLFIALQVWEHLKDKQKEAFGEVIRISKMAVLSFPLNWNCPGNCHHGITEEVIADWTLNIEPVKKIQVKNRIIYFFKF